MRSLFAVSATIFPPTLRLYSVIHSGLAYGPTPPSPVRLWSSLEPSVITSAFGWSAAITPSMWSGQLNTSGRASPVATCPSTKLFATSMTSVPGATFTNDSPGVIDSESPPTHTFNRFVGENACFFGGTVVVTGVPSGVVPVVIGSGSDALMSSSPLRPAIDWMPFRSSSIWSA